MKEALAERGIELGPVLRREGARILRPAGPSQIFLGGGGAFLVGEAAGWISQSSAEGISYAIRSALALGTALEETAGDAVLGRLSVGLDEATRRNRPQNREFPLHVPSRDAQSHPAHRHRQHPMRGGLRPSKPGAFVGRGAEGGVNQLRPPVCRCLLPLLLRGEGRAKSGSIYRAFRFSIFVMHFFAVREPERNCPEPLE